MKICFFSFNWISFWLCFLIIKFKKGIYYLVSDINFRFVQNVQHCYNLTSYASSAIGLYLDNEKNIEDAFKYGIYSYCKSILSRQSHNGGSLYQSKKNDSELPFMFFYSIILMEIMT